MPWGLFIFFDNEHQVEAKAGFATESQLNFAEVIENVSQ